VGSETLNNKKTDAVLRISLSVLAAAAVFGPFSGNSALAQDDAEELLEEIIVVGTRRTDRTAANTPVPVDVFNRQDLASASSDDMLDIIETLVPSFQVNRFAISDGRTFVRPPELRGMSGDKILVLVNGKRRHRSAVVRTDADGANGPDLATIPGIALKNVEVLRDGASALYGSDAIAGVFNFILRDSAQGGELQMQVGQYTQGDENGYLVALNQGFSIGDNGFINISAELSDNAPTSRGTYFDRTIGSSGLTPVEAAQISGLFDHDLNPATPDQMRYGPDAMTEVYDPVSRQLVTVFPGSDGIPDDTGTQFADNLQFAEISSEPFVMVWGAPDREAIRSFINAGFEFANGTELYGWANYSDSDSNGPFFYRGPSDSPFLPLRTPTGEIYNPRTRFPAGFTPRFAGNVIDKSFTGGVRGEFGNGLLYDFGGRWGESEVKYEIHNTLNPSLGPASPTSFRPGGLISDEYAFNADFVLPVDVGFASDLNVAFGAEYRNEGYELVQGDPKSWEGGSYGFPDPFNFEIDADEAAAGQNGGSVGCFIPGPQFDPTNLCNPNDPIHNVASAGSNGFTGYGPNVTSTYGRDSWAAYVDLEADITDRFLATIAGRYEDFSDYGSNFSWRVAGLFQVSDTFKLRASAGTGFRAPTPGQISTINIRTAVSSGGPITAGLFPPQHPAPQLFGAVPLDEETSTQFTLGVATEPIDALTLTLDYYFIALDDQIWRSSNLRVSPAQRALLQAQGVQGAETLVVVRYFTNDIDTETSGFDLVTTWNIDWGAGSTIFSLAANVNKSEVTRRTNRQSDPANPDPVYFLNDAGVFRFEEGDPEYRVIFTTRHGWNNDITAGIRGSAYGDYALTDDSFTQIVEMSGKTYWDADVTWDINDVSSITFGVDNIFDEYPDLAPPLGFSGCCGIIYDTSTAMDWQGTYYYLRGVLRWN
jgi:iron complex outermembrane receptor protein